MALEPSSTGGVTLTSTEALRENAVRLLRALIRSNYYGQSLPPVEHIQQATRIPRGTLDQALLDLENEDTVVRNTMGGYDCLFLPDVEKAGEVVFLLNADFFQQGHGVFQAFLIGFEQAMHDEHYEVIFRTDFESVSAKAANLREFHERGISGVAFCSFAEPSLRQYVVEHDIPSIIIGNASIHQEELGCVCSDNIGGMGEMVRFLAENGHRHIAYYTPAVRNHDGFEERLIGYEIGMRKAGLHSVSNLVFSERHNPQLAGRAATIIQSMHPEPTAVVCATDRDAFELMTELDASGIKVPDDMTVAGWGNGIFCGLSEPTLTSIDIHAEMMGQVSAHYLLNETRGHQIPIRMMLPTQIVIRESVLGIEYRDEAQPDRSLSKKTARVSMPEDDEELYDF